MKKSYPEWLRGVVRDDGRVEEPRKYAQSTSGLTSSQGIAPELSRSSEIQIDSPMDCLVDIALRRYPTDVPQRFAKSSWSSVDSELRYFRSDSMTHKLPSGNFLSIPGGDLPCGNSAYPAGMDVYEIRRLRLIKLVDECGGNKKFAEIVTNHRGSPIQESYISRCKSAPDKKGHKAVSSDFARMFERAAGKPKEWLDHLDNPSAEVGSKSSKPAHEYWPFSLQREVFDSLSLASRRQLDQTLTDLALSAHQREANQRKKKEM